MNMVYFSIVLNTLLLFPHRKIVVGELGPLRHPSSKGDSEIQSCGFMTSVYGCQSDHSRRRARRESHGTYHCLSLKVTCVGHMALHTAARSAGTCFLWESRKMRRTAWVLEISVLCCAKLLQSCLTLCDPMDCSPPGSSVHGILQPRILEWVTILFSRGSYNPGVEPRSPVWPTRDTYIHHIKFSKAVSEYVKYYKYAAHS